jgi:hypothetical protein
MSAVVRWVNEAYSLIQFLHGRKDACYRGKKIDRREYRVQSRALRDLLLSNDALKAQVADDERPQRTYAGGGAISMDCAID